MSTFCSTCPYHRNLFCCSISWTTCKSFAPRSRQITMPASHHPIFTGRMPFLMPNRQLSKQHNVMHQHQNSTCHIYTTPRKPKCFNKCQKVAAWCNVASVNLGWSRSRDVAKSTDTQHADRQLRVHHSAEQVIDKHLDQ